MKIILFDPILLLIKSLFQNLKSFKYLRVRNFITVIIIIMRKTEDKNIDSNDKRFLFHRISLIFLSYSF
jgi:hypothetical protein